MRRVDQLVAVLQVLVPPEIFDRKPHSRPFRMPKNQPRADGLGRTEQVQLAAELAVVAQFRFLDLLEVRIELLLRIERCSVQALEHRVRLMAAVIRTGNRQQFDRLDAAGAFQMRSTAEIDKLAAFVKRDGFAFGDICQAFELELLAAFPNQLLGFRASHFDSFERMVFGEDLLHLLFDHLEIFGGQTMSQIKIVVEPIVGGRTNIELDVLKETANRSRHDMRRTVAHFLKVRIYVFHSMIQPLTVFLLQTSAKMVGVTGLEPVTPSMSRKCSSQLSYTPA